MHGKRKPSQTLDLQLFDGQVGHAATPWMNAGPAIWPRPALVEWREARREPGRCRSARPPCPFADPTCRLAGHYTSRSEEHPSELQSLMRISYAVFCLKK